MVTAIVVLSIVIIMLVYGIISSQSKAFEAGEKMNALREDTFRDQISPFSSTVSAISERENLLSAQSNKILSLEKELYEEKKKNRKPFNVKVIFIGPQAEKVYECYSYNDLGSSLLFYDNDGNVIAKAKDYHSFEVMK